MTTALRAISTVTEEFPVKAGKLTVESHLPVMPQTSRAFSFQDEIRFWSHVSIVGDCWVCDLKGARGYTRFRVNRKSVFSHRWAWDLVNDPINPDERLDHKCRNRACVNPKHLRILDSRTNTLIGNGLAAINAKKTHCLKGHPLSGENLIIEGPKNRRCRACKRAKDRRIYWRERGVVV